MFHTPPTKQTWPVETAINNSYNSEGTEVVVDSANKTESEPSSITAANTQPTSPSILEDAFEMPEESSLPLELLKEYEAFLKYLKEPRFARPLATCEIADLFHRFYRKFSAKAHSFVYDSGVKQPVELPEYDTPRDYACYIYNVLAERMVCDKFYSSIMFPSKGISIDDYVRKLNDSLAVKLACLHSLNIKFSHLDIDLPEDEEKFFVDDIHKIILPIFELFSSERSPTLKAKYLYKIHITISTIIQHMETGKNPNFAMNTDIYLPVLIYTIIQLEDLRTHSLVSQLNFMKQFTDEYIYQLDDETYRDERGKLLYVLTNFEACISYLASVTLDDLHIEPPGDETDQQVLDILTKPMVIENIEEETRKYKQAHSVPRSRSSSYFPSSFQQSTPLSESIYHADQGLRNISRSVDASLKSIMGKVPWIAINSSSPKDGDTLDNALRQQLEENLAFQESQKTLIEDHHISPISSSSISTGSNSLKHHSNLSLSSIGSKTGIPAITTAPSLPPERLLSRLTNSVGSAVKNFLPASASSSNISLGVQSESQQRSKVRSRAASLMSGSFFSGSPQRISRSSSLQQIGNEGDKQGGGIFNTLENALETVKNRSRGNSVVEPPKQFNKTFEQMSIEELKEMFEGYQSLTNKTI
ncbi:hypothetical protein FOA43_003011 [Brettanomyces nanus]|uniref:VPS9 domain-containing protein n=1 Tax=Eeniella nana TaxID=13502 RepID=A0A875S9A8_EENNA|nr:uncharacterized protein FOA43_003011 [Brettanomyces nanus]QPG75654.1 hypothetical protein FOA43_003011 [Brettanomyces nanus]